MLIATPVSAHHEVVVATSMMPVLAWLAVIAAGVIAGLTKWFRRK